MDLLGFWLVEGGVVMMLSCCVEEGWCWDVVVVVYFLTLEWEMLMPVPMSERT